MKLNSLTNIELENLILANCLKNRELTVELLYYLAEFEKRKLYLEKGYSSLFEYCTKKLMLSEGAAGRRVAACRALIKNPELGDLLIQGKVTLSSISTLSKNLISHKAKPEDLIGKSTREVELIVAQDSPKTKKKESIKPIFVSPKTTSAESTPAPEPRFEIKFSVSKEEYERFNQAKDKLSNSLGGDLSVERVFKKLFDNFLDKAPGKARTNRTDTRYIPESVKAAVYKRDGGRCTFVGCDGRCTATKYLQFDHITPYYNDGKTDVSNLRLLCSAHNQFIGREMFGNVRSRPKAA